MRDWSSVKAIHNPVVPTSSLQLLYKMDNWMGVARVVHAEAAGRL